MTGRILRLLLPALALVGIGYAVSYTTVIARREPPLPNQLTLPAESLYPATVSGSGLIEANSRNIEIGSFVSGIVVAVPIVEGRWVKAGDTLFVLDRRLSEAELATAERDVTAADARVVEARRSLPIRRISYAELKSLSPAWW